MPKLPRVHNDPNTCSGCGRGTGSMGIGIGSCSGDSGGQLVAVMHTHQVGIGPIPPLQRHPELIKIKLAESCRVQIMGCAT